MVGREVVQSPVIVMHKMDTNKNTKKTVSPKAQTQDRRLYSCDWRIVQRDRPHLGPGQDDKGWAVFALAERSVFSQTCADLNLELVLFVLEQ